MTSLAPTLRPTHDRVEGPCNGMPGGGEDPGGRDLLRCGRTPDYAYQQEAHDLCVQALEARNGPRVACVLPTGAGKSRVGLDVALTLLERHAAPGARVAWMAHRAVLLGQARAELRTLQAELERSGRRERARLGERIDFHMVSGNPPWERGGALPGLIVVDEAHHAAAPGYDSLVRAGLPVPRLLLTATPKRTDDRPIGADVIAYTATYRQMFAAGVVMEPTFLDPLLVDMQDVASQRRLARYVVENAALRFTKTLVVASRVEHVASLHQRLVEAWAAYGPAHPLAGHDIYAVSGSGPCTPGPDVEASLAQYARAPRAVLVATAQLLGEGFNDPATNAVVMTYATTSMLQLMQVAGRCLRIAPGKQAAYVVQAQDSAVAYHFHQRWLYQDISDWLRPRLVDVDCTSAADLREQVREALEAHHVNPAGQQAVLDGLRSVPEGTACSLMLSGLHYEGSPERFAQDAHWSAVLDVPGQPGCLVPVFNAYCERLQQQGTTPLHDPLAWLQQFHKPGVLDTRQAGAGSLAQRLVTMLLAMDGARAEVYPAARDARRALPSRRPYSPAQGTSHLKYMTFRVRAQVPAALVAFLGECHNAQAITEAYLASPARWAHAVRLPHPLGGWIASLLDGPQSGELAGHCASLRQVLADSAPAGAFRAIAAWRAGRAGSRLPQEVLERLEMLASEEAFARGTLDLSPRAGPAAAGDGTPA